jgi:sugar/nucleoside kinase (ribokinase family)
MSTFLGACGQLTVDDIDEATVAAASVTYFEGYMWDTDNQKAAILKAMDFAHSYDGLVSISLSDSFCVDRFRGEFLELIRDRVDILFANEHEIKSLYEVDSFDDAMELLRPHVKVAALTRSEKGSVIIAGNATYTVIADQADVVDTTGAGDMYAAGFLYGYTNGRDLKSCGKLGSLAAAEVISHLGARPETPLANLAKEKNL